MNVLCFGCIGVPGHYLHSKGERVSLEDTPWGSSIDGGLLGDDEGRPKCVEVHKDGWTCVSFWDRSGDHRGNSNTAFMADCECTGEELLRCAREQWPEVFRRAGFPKPSIG